jgi:hypothetical protein
VQQLKQLVQKFQSFGSINKTLSEITNRLLSAQIELADIAGELNH